MPKKPESLSRLSAENAALQTYADAGLRPPPGAVTQSRRLAPIYPGDRVHLRISPEVTGEVLDVSQIDPACAPLRDYLVLLDCGQAVLVKRYDLETDASPQT